MIHTILNEGARGCGYRKKGGLYLVSDGLSNACGRMPIPCGVCPTCHAGIKFSRGWTWIDPRPLIASLPVCDTNPIICGQCPVGFGVPERAGLLWIGERHYKTPELFTAEAARQGVSRRIHAIPKDFKLGETWVLTAHIKAIDNERPGIFHAFRPRRIEYIVKGDETPEQLEAMEKRGITLIDLQRTDGKQHETVGKQIAA